jgi:3-methyladenine DNA glycosylase/8-oxoguanine DNA glycosylase
MSTVAGVPGAERITVQGLGTTYSPREAVNLRATLRMLGRGPFDPVTQWTSSGFWRGMTTPDGPATLRLTQRTGTFAGFDGMAWGPGAEWAIAGVPELLGEGDDWDGLDVKGHPILRDVQRRMRGLRLTRTRRVFDVLAPAVIEQRVTGVEAYRSWARLARRHGVSAPGPVPDGLRIPPDADTLRHIPSWEWHRIGVDPRRSRVIVEAARVADGLERTVGLGRGGSEVASRLRTVLGIGAWTAAEIAQRAHGDPDAVSVGDYNLPGLVGYVLIGRTVDDDGMLDLLEPWAGQRQRVVRLIESSGIGPPRRAPRSTIPDHRGR